jgi:hypothetical protein
MLHTHTLSHVRCHRDRFAHGTVYRPSHTHSQTELGLAYIRSRIPLAAVHRILINDAKVPLHNWAVCVLPTCALAVYTLAVCTLTAGLHPECQSERTFMSTSSHSEHWFSSSPTRSGLRFTRSVREISLCDAMCPKTRTGVCSAGCSFSGAVAACGWAALYVQALCVW